MYHATPFFSFAVVAAFFIPRCHRRIHCGKIIFIIYIICIILRQVKDTPKSGIVGSGVLVNTLDALIGAAFARVARNVSAGYTATVSGTKIFGVQKKDWPPVERPTANWRG
jgi:hypothetical protein